MELRDLSLSPLLYLAAPVCVCDRGQTETLALCILGLGGKVVGEEMWGLVRAQPLEAADSYLRALRRCTRPNCSGGGDNSVDVWFLLWHIKILFLQTKGLT